jgi:hypothetical protein
VEEADVMAHVPHFETLFVLELYFDPKNSLDFDFVEIEIDFESLALDIDVLQ